MAPVSKRAVAQIKTGNQLAMFKPERHRLKVAALDYGIDEAKRIKDWPALEGAVDEKIEEQRRFVGWWKVKVTDKGGGNPTVPRTRDGALSMRKAEDLTGMANQRVADLRKRLKKPDKYRETLLGASYRAAMLEVAGNVRGTAGTGENEWHTPERYLDLARTVLGGIDLDPASSKAAQKSVKAKEYFTLADNGLKQEWYGRVWLNPPYAQPAIAHFVDKLVDDWQAGRVAAAILLTHNYTDTAWFHKAAGACDAICFTRGRIGFIDPDGAVAAPTQGQAFFYFGDKISTTLVGGDSPYYRSARFGVAFSEIGFVSIPLAGQGWERSP